MQTPRPTNIHIDEPVIMVYHTLEQKGVIFFYVKVVLWVSGGIIIKKASSCVLPGGRTMKV